MSQWIVRCPACLRTYGITDEERTNATGKFRCGFCYATSEIAPNLFRQKPQEPAEAPKQETVARPALSPEQQAALDKMKDLARRMQSFDAMREPTLAPAAREERMEPSFSPASVVTINAPQAEEGLRLLDHGASPEEPPAPPAAAPLAREADPAEDEERPLEELASAPKKSANRLWLALGILFCAVVAVQGVCLVNDKVTARLPASAAVFDKACKVFTCAVPPAATTVFSVNDARLEELSENHYGVFFTIGNTTGSALDAPVILLTVYGDKDVVITRKNIDPQFFMPQNVTRIEARSALKVGFAFDLKEGVKPVKIRLTAP